MILFVVVNHSVIANCGHDEFISKIIYSSVLPAFFVISGFLMYLTFKDNEIIWSLRKIVQRSIPIFIFGSLYYLFSHLSAFTNNGVSDIRAYYNEFSFSQYWFNFMPVTGFGEGLWFLWTLLLCGIIVAITHLMIRRLNFNIKISVLSYIFVCLAICCIKISSVDSYGLEDVQWMLPFFIMGYLISMGFERIKTLYKQILFIFSVAFICMLFIKDFGNNWSNVSMWLWNTSYASSIFKIEAAICGIGFSIFIFFMMSKVKFIGKILAYCGENSLAIYCIHPIVIAMPFMAMGYSRVVVGFMISMIFTLLTGFILRRFWLTRAVVFGEIKDLRRIVAYGNHS